MRITVECYGASRRWCGSERLQLELAEGARVIDAVGTLAATYPDLAARKESVAVAVGDEIVSPARKLADGEHLALIPPVSGG